MDLQSRCQSTEETAHPQKQLKYYLTAVFALAVIVVILFVDLFFRGDGAILSYPGSDLQREFLQWRHFGFEQLKHGNLALWNPHIYCGMPFFGGFQAALLYPPNFLFLVLPISAAFNVSIAMHIFLAGLFMFLWAWYRGLKPQACFLSAALLMFCGPYYMHLSVGHVSNLCTMAWVPLILLCVDGIFDRRSLNWMLAGVAAVSMMILAGHPQYVFYTAVATAIYILLRLINHSHRIRILSLLAIMGVWAGLLVSLQLWTGLQESAYSVRGDGGQGFHFAAFFSFPPENLMTLIAPKFFGWISDDSYWGRCYLWEMSLFFGVTGLVLAVYGQICGSSQQRRFCLTLIIILFVLAMGAHTPLFKFLYNFVPGFDKFRGNSKFIFPMIVFAVMLAGIGLHNLIDGRPLWKWIIGIAAVGIILVMAGNVIVSKFCIEYWWHDFMKFVQAAAVKYGESYLRPDLYDNYQFVSFSANRASNSLYAAGGLFLLVAGLFALKRKWQCAVYLIMLAALGEMIIFAVQLRPTFDSAEKRMPEQIKDIIAGGQADLRILYLSNDNGAMLEGLNNIWGDDPGILRRYSRFMDFAEKSDAGATTKTFTHRFFSLLRLGYVIYSENSEQKLMKLNNPVLPRLSLISDFKVVSDSDSILQMLASPGFDPNRTVVLESPPDILPQYSAYPGKIKITDESTDHLTIEADINSPAILLVSDAYHPNWKVKALAGSSQSRYELLPADYVLRAVPLNKGTHRFRMEYQPAAFITGTWISIVSLAVYAGFCLLRFAANIVSIFFARKIY